MESVLWTGIITGATAALTTWKIAEVTLRSELKAQAARLSIVERQTEALLLLSLETALAANLTGPALDAARAALARR